MFLYIDCFSGHEAISEIYSYQVTFTCQDHDLQPVNLLRKSTTLTFLPSPNIDSTLIPSPFVKHIHGVITDFRRLSGSLDEAQYQLFIQTF
ncbi:hypothetical protein JEP40_13490 [Proteus vulgaris]|uniref:hypothetical protein n=1 Tax=Proteus vulgaris TaxID=585 RepID=UPI0018E4A9B7|nr:hypothetical protein [Proteus vulgaris]MBI6530123.1 hypothetical protein [Proteus vulgaris]